MWRSTKATAVAAAMEVAVEVLAEVLAVVVVAVAETNQSFLFKKIPLAIFATIIIIADTILILTH